MQTLQHWVLLWCLFQRTWKPKTYWGINYSSANSATLGSVEMFFSKDMKTKNIQGKTHSPVNSATLSSVVLLISKNKQTKKLLVLKQNDFPVEEIQNLRSNLSENSEICSPRDQAFDDRFVYFNNTCPTFIQHFSPAISAMYTPKL